MKIIFLSNYFNHHQMFLSNEYFKFANNDYYFIETGKMSLERKNMGWGVDTLPPYVVQLHEYDGVLKKTKKMINEADIVIQGSAPTELISERLKQNKLIFCYAERVFKHGFNYFKWPVRLVKFWLKYGRYKHYYLLCASAYTAFDFSRMRVFSNKAYKWGYFTECKKYNIDGLIAKKEFNDIVWCGRFLDWKHPDDVLKVAKRLSDEGYTFRVNMIGTGEIESSLKQYVEENDLGDVVTFLGSMKPEEVRKRMEKAGIYLFTSDRREGWGAVLNESLNSGCAVVASHAVGSTPFLIKNKENGLIYESENVDMLYEKVKYLLDYPEEQKRLGKAAYQTIISEWNPEVAAERFINLSKHIISGEKHPDLYKSGPCSKAERIKDNWFKG